MPPGLIERVKSGDEAAFIELVNTYQQSVRSFVASWAPSRGEADEIAQDVFITAQHSFDTFDNKKEFKAWLLDIARNMTRNAWRRVAGATQRNEVNELCTILELAAAGSAPPTANSDERTQYFAERQAQGALDASDFAEMIVLFKQPQAVQNFVSTLSARHEKDLGTQNSDAFVKAVLERKQGRLDLSRTRRPPEKARKPGGISILPPILVVFAVCAVLYFCIPRRTVTDVLRKDGLKVPPVEAIPANAKLTHINGHVLIHRGELTKVGADGTELFVGDVIETGRGSAVVSYKGQSTTLALNSGTALSMDIVDLVPHPRLLNGNLDADILHQKEPIVISTPAAEVKTLDAELTLGIEGKDALLQVHSGSAQLARPTDGASVEVQAGHFGLVSTDPSLKPVAKPMLLTRAWRERDIGANKTPGSASQKDDAFTLKASGGDLAGRGDGFHFVYQPLNGDCDLTAHVVSITSTKDFGLAGIMVRETLEPDSPHATLAITTENSVQLRRRLVAGESTESASRKTPAPLPLWLRLTRSNDLFTTYASTDGKIWTLVDEVTVRMNENVFAGLVLLNHDNAAECTGVFESVKFVRLTPPP